ncbi:glycosyl hydrolase [Verrucomicrobia bacterium LW23]|nr:glycosyl hydrolase [Verrucomicrobia bacterium LW23]
MPPQTVSTPRPHTPPPGVVISHQPSGNGLFVGSPAIANLQDGALVAAHDFFGPESGEFQCGTTLIFRSEDRGATWTQTARLDKAFWCNLFQHRGAVWLLGVTHHHGLVCLRRSDDGGRTWSEPALLTASGQYHTGPMPVAIHNGRLWRAIEDASSGHQWGRRYNPCMLSAAEDSDLMDPASWTLDRMGTQRPEWLGGLFGGWLEGNAVVLPATVPRSAGASATDDDASQPVAAVGNLLRVEYPPGGKAALLRPGTDKVEWIELPGGSTKFTVRHDSVSGLYWTLANAVPARYSGTKDNHASIRNTLMLLCSSNLRQWTRRAVILQHPDVHRHGFQYADWHFDGNDMIAAVRTAWEDATGGAPNEHDANYLTFHRIKDFRALENDCDGESFCVTNE